MSLALRFLDPTSPPTDMFSRRTPVSKNRVCCATCSLSPWMLASQDRHRKARSSWHTATASWALQMSHGRGAVGSAQNEMRSPWTLLLGERGGTGWDGLGQARAMDDGLQWMTCVVTKNGNGDVPGVVAGAAQRVVFQPASHARCGGGGAGFADGSHVGDLGRSRLYSVQGDASVSFFITSTTRRVQKKRKRDVAKGEAKRKKAPRGFRAGRFHRSYPNHQTVN